MIIDNKDNLDIINSISSITNIPHNDVAVVLELYSVLLKSKIYDNSDVDIIKLPILDLCSLDINNTKPSKVINTRLHNNQFKSIIAILNHKYNPLLYYLNQVLPNKFDNINL